MDALGFYDGQVWQKNDDNLWFSKTSAGATWVDYPPAGGNPMPVPPVLFNEPVTAYDGETASAQFSDTHGNLWQINAAGQVVDGRVDATTNRVVAIELVNGRVWQENADGNWYSTMKPSDTWTTAVRTDPVLAAQAGAETWVGGHNGNDPTVGLNWSKGAAPTPDRNLLMTSGVMNLGSGSLGGVTLTVGGQPYRPSIVDLEAAAPVINMTAGGSLSLAFAQSQTNAAKVNVTGGRTALDVTGPYPAEPDLLVTADKLSSLLLSGDMTFGRMVEHGGTVLLNGSFVVGGTNVLLDSSLAGVGLVRVLNAQSVAGKVEVTGSVGADVTLAVHGDPYRNAFSTVTLDNGLMDHGAVTLDDSVLVLKGLGKVDGMSYKNSVLSLYNGQAVVDAVKVAGVADPAGGISNGVLSFAYSAGTLTVHDGGTAANAMGFGTVTGLALHA